MKYNCKTLEILMDQFSRDQRGNSWIMCEPFSDNTYLFLQLKHGHTAWFTNESEMYKLMILDQYTLD